MSRYWNEKTDEPILTSVLRDIIVGTLFLVLVNLAGCPRYRVYEQKMEGLAELQRAKGVAEANRIIGDSLNNNEAYLRYLWITEVSANRKDRSIVYIPTEAGMPILEAGKRE